MLLPFEWEMPSKHRTLGPQLGAPFRQSAEESQMADTWPDGCHFRVVAWLPTWAKLSGCLAEI